MSESAMTREELLAQNAELKVEVRMLAAAGAAKAAARAADAAAASGKKAMARSEFEAKPSDVRRKLMLVGRLCAF
jgi:hypothetical protein